MDFPIQPVLLSLPSLIYLGVQRLRGSPWRGILDCLGIHRGRAVWYLAALGIALAGALFFPLAMRMIPASALNDPHVNLSSYQGLAPGLPAYLWILFHEALYVALGEEIFFRGFAGGWLMRRLGFWAGNLIQSLLFLLPHLLLLSVSLAFWPLTIAQFLAGWLQGWLRWRSNSIGPGWLAHTLSNTVAAILTLA